MRGSDYLETVQSAMWVGLPIELQPLASTVVDMLAKKSTVKHARFLLDLALTLQQQERSKALSPARRSGT